MDEGLIAQSERTEKFLQIMDELEYRRVETTEDLEAVGRLRAKSYGAFDLVTQKGPIIDALDHHSHSYVYALYFREQMISTIRLHHVVAAERHGASMDIFPDVLNPLLDQGLTFIDCVRHASDPEMIGDLPMPFLTLRLVAMACHYLKADYTLAPIRKAHWAFYRRAFGATQFADARQHKGVNDPVGLFASKYETMYGRVTDRFPFFRSLPKEQELLFAPASQLAGVPLSIRPTARFAIARHGQSAHVAA